MFEMIIEEKATEPAASQFDTVFKCELFLISLLHSCLNTLHFQLSFKGDSQFSDKYPHQSIASYLTWVKVFIYNVLTYLLTPWSRVLLEKLTGL
jgi:hypothetical protein